MGFENSNVARATEIPLNEQPKKQEAKEGWRDLDKERQTRFDWILNDQGITTLDQFENMWSDALEYPDDYPNFDKERAERLMKELKNFDAHSEEFKESVEKVAAMLK